MTKIALIGLTIAIALNLFGLVLGQPGAHFFNAVWWAAWFPLHALWFFLAAVGFGVHLAKR